MAESPQIVPAVRAGDVPDDRAGTPPTRAGWWGLRSSTLDVVDVGAPAGPPARERLLGEARALAQAPRLGLAAPWLARAPRGAGQLVLDLPGWKAGQRSNVAMRSWLRWLGYDIRPWGLGVNHGDPERDAERLVATLETSTRPVALIGWSLGGTISREVARSLPDVVSTVVTYGSPVVGGPTFTAAAAHYGRRECERVAAMIEDLDRDQPITVPITAILTRRDGIVDWRACVDRTSPRVRHVEVRSTHLGLGFDPDVWWAVAEGLSRHAGAPRSTGGEAAVR